MEGTSLDGHRADEQLYNLSAQCGLGRCDAFFSHTWKDEPSFKWAALRRWCGNFTAVSGRAPNMWLDKVCIDQCNVAADLQCLPIFLAGCNTLLVVSGLHYTTRLWCCVELFTYVAMMQEDASRQPPEVLLLGSARAEMERVAELWLRFDVLMCDCCKPQDKTRILAIIRQYTGGTKGFNQRIRELGVDLLATHSAFSARLSIADPTDDVQVISC